MTTVVDTNPSELVLKGTVERLDIKLGDANGSPVAATECMLSLRYLDDTVIYADDFFNPPVIPGVTRIVNPSLGHYYFPMGDQSIIANTETANIGRFAAVWSVTGPIGSENENIVQNVRVVSTRTMAMLGDFRLLIDKALMAVNEDPDNPCYLGYTDSMLVRFLEGGLESWNLYEPYPTFCGLDSFPMIYEQGLLEAALLVGVMSQELFAVATDIPSYSAQGSSFVIQHQPALAQYFTKMAQRLDKIIPIAKLKLVRSGSIHTQIGPNYRLATLVQMAPGGALFRNAFFRS